MSDYAIRVTIQADSLDEANEFAAGIVYPGETAYVLVEPDGGPVTVQALLDDWDDRPGLTEEARLALIALSDDRLAGAIETAFLRYQDMWLDVLDNTRGDATRALLTELGFEEDFS